MTSSASSDWCAMNRAGRRWTVPSGEKRDAARRSEAKNRPEKRFRITPPKRDFAFRLSRALDCSGRPRLQSLAHFSAPAVCSGPEFLSRALSGSVESRSVALKDRRVVVSRFERQFVSSTVCSVLAPLSCLACVSNRLIRTKDRSAPTLLTLCVFCVCKFRCAAPLKGPIQL